MIEATISLLAQIAMQLAGELVFEPKMLYYMEPNSSLWKLPRGVLKPKKARLPGYENIWIFCVERPIEWTRDFCQYTKLYFNLFQNSFSTLFSTIGLYSRYCFSTLISTTQLYS